VAEAVYRWRRMSQTNSVLPIAIMVLIDATTPGAVIIARIAALVNRGCQCAKLWRGRLSDDGRFWLSAAAIWSKQRQLTSRPSRFRPATRAGTNVSLRQDLACSHSAKCKRIRVVLRSILERRVSAVTSSFMPTSAKVNAFPYFGPLGRWCLQPAVRTASTSPLCRLHAKEPQRRTCVLFLLTVTRAAAKPAVVALLRAGDVTSGFHRAGPASKARMSSAETRERIPGRGACMPVFREGPCMIHPEVRTATQPDYDHRPQVSQGATRFRTRISPRY
jgi:hypothetical protein